MPGCVPFFFATLDILTRFGSPNLLKGPLQLPDSYHVYTKMHNAKLSSGSQPLV